MKPRYSKQKTSMRVAHGGTGFVSCAGYCSMHALLSGFEPWFYNAGLYGWNNDTYLIRDICGNTWAISTGYRNLQAEHLPYDIMEEYEKKAAATQDIEERRALCREFLARVANEDCNEPEMKKRKYHVCAYK